MDLFNDVIWPLFITALVITAIVCFTKLIWDSIENSRRSRAQQLAAWKAQERAMNQQREAHEMRYGRGGY